MTFVPHLLEIIFGGIAILMFLSFGFFLFAFNYYWFRIVIYSSKKIWKENENKSFFQKLFLIINKHLKLGFFNFKSEDKTITELGQKSLQNFKRMWISMGVGILLILLFVGLLFLLEKIGIATTIQ